MKRITMPYTEYKNDLKAAEEKGFKSARDIMLSVLKMIARGDKETAREVLEEDFDVYSTEEFRDLGAL